mgnify:CR=1 FL=1
MSTLKSAEETRKGMLNGKYVFDNEIHAIQANCFRAAAEMIVEDGNPALAKERIEAEAAKLSQ